MPSANRKAPHMTSPPQKTTRFIPITSQNVSTKSALQQALQRASASTSSPTPPQNGMSQTANGTLVQQNGQAHVNHGIRASYNTGSLMNPIKIDDILSQMDPSAQLNDDVKEALLEFLNDYIDKILEKSCQVAKFRGSKKVDPKDVEYVIKRIHKP